MKKRKFTLSLLPVLLPCIIYSQDLSNLREKYILVMADTVQIDTLSIIPNTIFITDDKGREIDSALYTIDYVNAILIWTEVVDFYDSTDLKLKISYRVFPYAFSKSYKHKDIKNIEPDHSGMNNPFTYTYNNTKGDIFKTDGLNKSGSISRGISFGNNQDVIVNSNLDLRLSGSLGNNINILAAITDDNIPIQPEGNTQQIQEFDKVFIQLSDENSKLIAGDFELEKPGGYFMNFYKKAQGANFETSFAAKKHAETPNFGISERPAPTMLHPGKMKITAAAAVSKGKFARNTFTGTEGNQGPYKLKGSENETFIIILSGTEKVYIDGELLARGQENDYVIDYNTAEITFTPKLLITKDKRIAVEFQYSEKNYTRSLLFTKSEFKKNNLSLYLNIYSEQDAKNQSLFQDLNSEDKQLLSEIGDNLDSAIAPNIDSGEFVTDLILYKKTDTIVNSILYKDVYVYSINPDSAFYKLGFSSVVDEEGSPNGNYVQVNTTINGKVFKWVAPDSITGRKQGNYEPIVLLITPKQKQMATFGGDYAFSKRTKMSFEVAGSNNDINTFSEKDRNDDAGYAFKVNFQNTSPLNNSEIPWTFKSILSYEQVDRYFSPIERYRSVEFERDWNLGGATLENEYIPGLDLSLNKEKTGVINYGFKSFFKGNEYNGFKNSANLNLNRNNFRLIFDGSLLKTTTTINNTRFVRSKAIISRQFRWFTLGVMEEQERNSFKDNLTDTLHPNSFEYYEWGVFVNNADTAVNKFTINYKQRTDLAPPKTDNRLKKSTIGESVGFTLDMLKNPNSRFLGNVTYRKLSVQDTAVSTNEPENSLLTRLEYRLRLLSGAITSGTFYEIGSGLEVKQDFLYLPVASGQGVYTWNDNNDNGIKELDEFEISPFQDQADHIKVFIPTNDYIKTFTNLFNEVLYIKPGILWNKKTGIRKFIARLETQTAYRIDRKTTDNDDLLSAYNPFLTETADTNLVTLNSSFRNTLYFNRTNPKFGIDLNFQDIRNKALLINDTTSRINTIRGIHFRWNMSKKFTADLLYNEGKKINTSRLFSSSKNYSISHYETEPKLTYQPNVKFRISVFYNLINKENKLLNFTTDSLGEDTIGGGENSIHNKIGIEIKHNVVSKGSLMMKVNFINISYYSPYNPDATNTSLAFEMLEGLQIGQNITWSIAYQRTLSKYMQLSITYDGRSSKSSNTIHTGGVQLRAYF